jgi:hypothetical protein
MSGQTKVSWRSWLPEGLRLRLRIVHIERRLKEIYRAYDIQWDEATTDFERGAIRSNLFHDIDPWDDELVHVKSQLLERRAERWDVEIPDDAFVDEEDPTDPGASYRYVGELHQQRVRRLIREERNSQVRFWLTVVGGVIAALTGLVGAMTGLMAVLGNNSN